MRAFPLSPFEQLLQQVQQPFTFLGNESADDIPEENPLFGIFDPNAQANSFPGFSLPPISPARQGFLFTASPFVAPVQEQFPGLFADRPTADPSGEGDEQDTEDGISTPGDPETGLPGTVDNFTAALSNLGAFANMASPLGMLGALAAVSIGINNPERANISATSVLSDVFSDLFGFGGPGFGGLEDGLAGAVGTIGEDPPDEGFAGSIEGLEDGKAGEVGTIGEDDPDEGDAGPDSGADSGNDNQGDTDNAEGDEDDPGA